MSIASRLFNGLGSLLGNVMSNPLDREFERYFIDVANDFLANRYYVAPIDDAKTAPSIKEHHKNNLRVVDDLFVFINNTNYLNIGNLNILAFILLRNHTSDFDFYFSPSTKAFKSKIEVNPLTVFAPKLISKTRGNALVKLGEKIELNVQDYIKMNIAIINSAAINHAKMGYDFFKYELHLKRFQADNTDALKIRSYLESFITTFMCGLGSWNWNDAFDNKADVLIDYKIDKKYKISYSLFGAKESWNDLLVDALRKNSDKVEYLQRLSHESLDLLDTYTTYNQFTCLFKNYFTIQLLSKSKLDMKKIDDLFDFYFEKIETGLKIKTIYCIFSITSGFINQDTYLMRLKNNAKYVYKENPRLKPTFSVL